MPNVRSLKQHAGSVMQATAVPGEQLLPKLILLLMFLALVLSFARPAELQLPTIKCERHDGPFSSAFSSHFDVNRVDCQLGVTNHSATVSFWTVPPYVGSL
jgi:hypothetical protein